MVWNVSYHLRNISKATLLLFWLMKVVVSIVSHPPLFSLLSHFYKVRRTLRLVTWLMAQCCLHNYTIYLMMKIPLGDVILRHVLAIRIQECPLSLNPSLPSLYPSLNLQNALRILVCEEIGLVSLSYRLHILNTYHKGTVQHAECDTVL